MLCDFTTTKRGNMSEKPTLEDIYKRDMSMVLDALMLLSNRILILEIEVQEIKKHVGMETKDERVLQ